MKGEGLEGSRTSGKRAETRQGRKKAAEGRETKREGGR